MPNIILLNAARSLVKKHNMGGPLLREAIPYIKKFEGKVFVLKIGGSILNNDMELLPYLIDDVVFLNKMGIKTILVHGGSKSMDIAMKENGIISNKINGLRVTTKEIFNIAIDVFSKISEEIKLEIENMGCKAIILDKKSSLIVGKTKNYQKYGLVGLPKKVNLDLINNLSDNVIPIVPAVVADEKGGLGLNVNADNIASILATKLKAEKLILMTDVEGVIDKKNNLIPSIDLNLVDKLIANKTISGGMLPKVLSCIEPVSLGVKKAHIIKGGKDSFINEILTDKGVGTEFIMSQAKESLSKISV